MISDMSAAVLFVIHSSTLPSPWLSAFIILSLIKSPNTPRPRLFDNLTVASPASFPIVDTCSVEPREQKSSITLFYVTRLPSV